MRRRLVALGGCLVGVTASALWLGRPAPAAAPVTQSTGPASSCRLPVYFAASRIGGFLTVPSYRFTPDPGAANGSRSYDATLHKWLPAEPRLVSPDGKWWAYQAPKDQTMTDASAIHIVDVHGVDRKVWSGNGIASLVGWAKAGAVFVHLSPDLHNVAEYWLIEEPSLTLRRVPSANGDPVGIDATGGGWTMRDFSNPTPNGNVPSMEWTLSRTDMATGLTETWFDRTLTGLVVLLGFDARQHPILRILPDVGLVDRVVVLTAPKTEAEIVHDGAAINFHPATTLGDEHGIWFGDSRSAVWQWTPKDGLRKVAQLSPTVDQVDVAEIAGPCV